jgi:hypothetical protein
MQCSPANALAVAVLTWTTGAVAASDVVPKSPAATLCPVSGTAPVTLREALSASTFRASDGAEIKLAGVIGPGEDAASLANAPATAARQVLARALADQPLSMAAVGVPDRYHRIPVQLFAGSAWIQETMVRKGLLRVSADQELGACAAPLLAAEHQAIAAMAGHWGDGAYTIRTPDQLASQRGRFEIVEGEVWRVRLLKGMAVIEFRNASNFQVSVPVPSVRDFRTRRFDIRRLRNRVIRVRGWIGLDDRLSIEVVNPALIELREEAPIRRR